MEWLPDVTIPFSGSRYEQRIRATLEPGSTIILWDAIASGRVARGERWAFAELKNEIAIDIVSGGRVLERYELRPKSGGPPVGLASEWDYAASLFVLGEGLGDGGQKRLEQRLYDLTERAPNQVLGGISEPAAQGVAVKLLASIAPALTHWLESAWREIRRTLWDLAAPSLRRY